MGEYILGVLDPTDLDDKDDDDESDASIPLTVAALVQMIPNLSEAQALELLTSAEEWHEVDVRPSESLTDATLKIQRMDIRLTQVHESVERLIHMSEMCSEM